MPALLVVSFVGAGCVSRMAPPCVEQSTEALIEIATGQLEDHAPFVAAWEREQARACGWVKAEDFRDESPESRSWGDWLISPFGGRDE